MKIFAVSTIVFISFHFEAIFMFKPTNLEIRNE